MGLWWDVRFISTKYWDYHFFNVLNSNKNKENKKVHFLFSIFRAHLPSTI